jgi:hypothetical protein
MIHQASTFHSLGVVKQEAYRDSRRTETTHPHVVKRSDNRYSWLTRRQEWIAASHWSWFMFDTLSRVLWVRVEWGRLETPPTFTDVIWASLMEPG